LAAFSFILLSQLFTLPSWAVEVYFAEQNTISDQARNISNRLKSSTQNLLTNEIETISSKAASDISGETNLIVAVGPEALLEIIAGKGTSPVVAVFVSKASYEKLLLQNTRPITAVFSDPDPVKQVALTRLLYGQNSTSAIISSPSIHTYINDYSTAAKIFGINLIIVELNKISSSSDFINSTSQAQSIQLLKDYELFQQIPLEKVLLSSYDINRQGVIGYSQGLVRNGAAATTFSSLADIARSISKKVNLINNQRPLDKPNFTETFEVAVNKYILRSLDLINAEEGDIKLKIVELLEGLDQ